MSAPQVPQHPIFEMVETATLAAPVDVPAKLGKQAGHYIVGAFCPKCFPNGGSSIHDMHWLNKPGRIVCHCGTHLNLVCPDFPEVSDGE